MNTHSNYLSGTCLFDLRIFLDISGHFHICEKVNHSYPIGDVEKGLDFIKMKNIVDEFMNLIKKECSGCIARHICKICFAKVLCDGNLSLDKEFCINRRRNFKIKLEEYIKLKKENLI